MLGMVLATLAYYALARVGLMLAVGQSNASAIWPPSGFGLALALLYGKLAWPCIFIGATLANITVFAQNDAAAPLVIVAVSLIIAAGNTIEAHAGAWLVQRLAGTDLRLPSLRSVYMFAVAIGTAAIAAALNGTVGLWMGGIITTSLLARVAATWWTGDFLGMLVVAPIALSLLQVQWRQLPAPRVSLLLLLAGTALFTGAIFYSGIDFYVSPYVLLLPVGWAAVRHGRGAVQATLAAIVGLAVVATAASDGPFDSSLLQHSLLDLCLFLTITTLISWLLAADTSALPRFSPIPLLALAVCMTLTVLTWEWAKGSIERDAQERFERAADSVFNNLQGRMESYESLLRAGSALYESSDSVEHREWRSFVTGLELSSQYPGVLGLGFAPFIPSGDVDSALGKIRRDGRPAFRIWPEGQRDFYAPVVMLEPEAGRNARAIGFDMLSESTRQRALLASMQNGRMTVTGPIILALNKEDDKELGFLMVNPAYDGGSRQLQGYVFAPFRIKELMAGIFENQLREVQLRIYYESIDSEPVYASELPEPGKSYLPMESVRDLLIGNNGQRWILRIKPTALFDGTLDQNKPLLLIMLGTTISLLFYGTSRNLVRQRQLAQQATIQSVERIKEQEASLQVSEARFRLLTAAIKNHAILLLGPDGTISTWNEGAHRLFGYEAEEIVGQPVNHLHLAGVAQDEIGLRTALEMGQFENMGLRRRRDGSTFLALAQTFPIRGDDGACIGFAKIVRDVTDEKAAEKELSDAKTLAEAASAAKSAFVANISHELRTPMNAVLGLAQVLARTPLSPDQKQYLDMISGAGKSLLALLNDVLDFSKIEANKVDLEDADYLLDDVIDALSGVMAVSGGDKGLEMTIRVDAGLPASLHGDGQRVRQVLLNLVSNAIKFTELGSVRLHAHLDPVRPGNLRFDITDTGIGIEPLQMERLFSPFSQADASMARKFGGTGLGLAISKRFASLMGGVIEVQSRPGTGSTFSFSIPLQAGRLADQYMLPPSLSGMRMLYVDDTAAGHAAVAELAKRWGCACDMARNEAELAQALASPRGYGLVLCDTRFALQVAKSLPADAVMISIGRGTEGDADLRHPVTRTAVWRLLSGLDGHAWDSGAVATVTPGAPAAAKAEATLGGLVLLLVEDNPLNQIVAKGLLESAGALVALANDGEEAVEALRASPSRFDLVLMDVQMPVMDGFTATQHIRARLGLDLPIIAMSAGVTLDERAACQAAGMDEFVAKPVDRETLLSAILRHVGRSHQAAGSPPAGLPASGLPPPQPPQLPQLPQLSDADAEVIFNVRHLEDLATRGIGKQSALADMVGRALNYGARTAQQVRADLADGDLPRAASGLHSLRGTYGTLGARRVVQATQAAEIHLLADPPHLPAADLERLWQEMAHADALAREWLQRQPSLNDQE
jgi:PAS domain S-box-containing protein